MIVAGTVIGTAVVLGLGATALGWRRSGIDPTDPHLERRTIRELLREHPVVRRLVRRHHPDPTVAMAEVLGVAAVGVLIAAAGAGVLLIMIRTKTGLQRVDLPIARWAADGAAGTSTDVMRAITHLGGSDVVIGVSVLVGAIELIRTRRWAVPAFIALAIGGQFLLSNSIKWIVERARPDLSPLAGFSGTSFPSGHAVAGAATWACVAFVIGRNHPRAVRAVLFGLAVAIGVAVAGSRVALGVHWTTDVLAGVLLGWAWFALCAIAFGGRDLHFGEPIAVATEEAEHTADDGTDGTDGTDGSDGNQGGHDADDRSGHAGATVPHR